MNREVLQMAMSTEPVTELYQSFRLGLKAKLNRTFLKMFKKSNNY